MHEMLSVFVVHARKPNKEIEEGGPERRQRNMKSKKKVGKISNCLIPSSY